MVSPPARVHLINTTGVVPQDEYVFLNYWSQIIVNPTPGVNALAAWQSLIQYMNVGRMEALVLMLYGCAAALPRLQPHTHAAAGSLAPDHRGSSS